MLQPKRTKFRKQMKGRNRGFAQVGNRVSFGEFGLKATTRGFVTARQIEAARRAITRYVKRGGKLWIRIYPDKPITKKPVEVRMGKGKGNVEYWVAKVQPGRVIYEIEGVSEELAREARDAGSLEALDFQLQTCIVLPPQAGSAFSAYKLGPGCSFHAGLNLAYTASYRVHNSRILMSLYHRIGCCRMLPMEHMNIASTNAYPFYFQYYFVGPRAIRL